MKSTPFESATGPRLPGAVQLQRVRRVLWKELTPTQREVLTAYYLQGQTIPQIAQSRGVHRSTISRTLKRAEDKMRRFLAY